MLYIYLVKCCLHPCMSCWRYARRHHRKNCSVLIASPCTLKLHVIFFTIHERRNKSIDDKNNTNNKNNVCSLYVFRIFFIWNMFFFFHFLFTLCSCIHHLMTWNSMSQKNCLDLQYYCYRLKPNKFFFFKCKNRINNLNLNFFF